MAKVFLNSGESFTLANSAEVYGAAGTGTEKVLLTGAATGITTDQNIERVELSGNVSAYTFQVVGNQVKVYSGTTLVTTIGVQGDADGTKVAFADGSADLKITGLNAATLGGQAVSSASATAITGATLNATDKSATAGSTGTTPGVGQAFTLTASTTADVPLLTTGNDTITGAAGTFASGDVLSDPSSTDNDTLNAVLTTSLTTAPTVSNIENVNLDFKGFGLIYNAASTSNGTITVSSTQDGNGTATLYNVGSTTKLAVGSGLSTLNLESSGTTLNLTGGQSLSVNNKASAGTMAFVSNGSSANTITYDAATGSKALTISGSQSLTIKTADLTDFTGNTVTKSLTGAAKATLEVITGSTAAATSDLSKVAVDMFNINYTSTPTAADTYQFAASSNVTLSKDIGAATDVLTVKTDTSSDLINLTVAAAQTGTVQLTNFETVNLAVATSVPLSIATLSLTTATNAATVNVTGTQDLSVTTLTASTTGTTLNAADFTGKLTATIGSNAATVVGGAGADTITGGTAADAIVGGSGADQLSAGATNGGTISDTIVGGAGNDVIYLGADNIVASTNLITFSTNASINGGDGVDSLAFAISTNNATLTGLIAQVENVTVANAGSGSITWTLADSDVTANSTLIFTVTGAGTGAVTLTGSAEKDGMLKIITVGGADTIVGGANNDTISAGAGADSITGGKGVDVLTGGAGNDTFVFAAGDSGITTATADVIIDPAASDLLKITSVSATAATSAFATGSQLGTGWSVSTKGIATKTNGTLDDFITAAAAAGKAGATGMNGQVAAFVSGADTYVFYAGTDTASNADDGLIKLTGLAVTDLATSYATAVFTLG